MKNMKLIAAVISVVSSVVAAPVLAGSDRYILPPGCKAFLTVQQKDCRVEHHWTCSDDPEGSQWIMSMGEGGPEFLQQVDREFVWLKSYVPDSRESRAIKRPAQDLNSLSRLLEAGADNYDFEVQVSVDGAETAVERVRGYDRLTGEKITIDGEPLLVIAYDYSEQSNVEDQPVKSSGKQYVSERFRSFFLGQGRDEVGGEVTEYDAAPVQFIEPGEAGFLSVKPQYGCSQIMSGLSLPRNENMIPNKETNDDI